MKTTRKAVRGTSKPVPGVQEMLLANDLFPGLAAGDKRVTIRRGHREVALGPLMFAPAQKGPRAPKPHRVQVVEVRHKLLCDVTDAEAQADGYHNALHLGAGLRRFYPGLKWQEEITLVYFET